jgi:hypothetical protein
LNDTTIESILFIFSHILALVFFPFRFLQLDLLAAAPTP